MNDKQYTVHVCSSDGSLGGEVAAFATEREAEDYAELHALDYFDGLLVARPDGVVIIGDGRYFRLSDEKECDIDGADIVSFTPRGEGG